MDEEVLRRGACIIRAARRWRHHAVQCDDSPGDLNSKPQLTGGHAKTTCGVSVHMRVGSVASFNFDLSIAVYAYIVKNHNLVAHTIETLVGGALAVVVLGLGLVLGLVGAVLDSADGTVELVADGVAVLGLLLVGL